MSDVLVGDDCPICGATDSKLIFDMSSFSTPHGIPGRIVSCARCKMWFKVPATDEPIDVVYGEEYAADAEIEAYMVGDSARAFFRDVLKGVRLPQRPERPRLLDIGTGRGALLDEAREQGFEAQGVELYEPLARPARERGFRVESKRAEDLAEREDFDVVTMMDFIEHVPDPLSVLEAAHRALKPGGELVVYTPNHRAAVVLLARLMHSLGIKFAAREIFGGHHLCFFDDRTLAKALDRASFETRRVRLFPYNPSRPGQAMSSISLLAVALVEQLGRVSRRMFRMVAYARKRS